MSATQGSSDEYAARAGSGGPVIGVVLAGGDATRMGGGDKGFACVGGLPILDRIVATLRPQCDDILISANGDLARFARFGCPVVPDADWTADGRRRGPLAGLLAALDVLAQDESGSPFVVTAPTDTPFLPHDLVARLQAARIAGAASIVCARSATRAHPVIALWSTALRDDLRQALEREQRKAWLFIERHRFAFADWTVSPHDPFLNVNTREDLAAAETIAADLARKGRLADPPPHRL